MHSATMHNQCNLNYHTDDIPPTYTNKLGTAMYSCTALPVSLSKLLYLIAWHYKGFNTQLHRKNFNVKGAQSSLKHVRGNQWIQNVYISKQTTSDILKERHFFFLKEDKMRNMFQSRFTYTSCMNLCPPVSQYTL